MISDIEKKLNKILDFWHQYVEIYSACRNKRYLNYTERGKQNYINSIIGYILDVHPIIFSDIINKTWINVNSSSESVLADTDEFYTSKMIADNISFLQSIYIQQDLMKELLYIFKKTPKNINDDKDYIINRNIRNELIGHPLGNHEGTLKNTTVFSYLSNYENVEYLKYAKENNYRLSIESFKRSEVISRHTNFMNNYLDKILLQIYKILNLLKKNIETCIEPYIDKLEFSNLLGMISNKYESMLNNTPGFDWYDKNILLDVYKKKNQHPRYEHVITIFMNNLKQSISDTKKGIDLFSTEQIHQTNWPTQSDLNKIILNNNISKTEDETNNIQNISLTNLNKLYSMENTDFDFQYGFLKDDCEKSPELNIELEHMKNNIGCKLEYYSAYYYAVKLLS